MSSLMRQLLMQQNNVPSYVGDPLYDAISGDQLETSLADKTIVPICQLMLNGDLANGTTSWNAGYGKLTVNDDGSVTASHSFNQDNKTLYLGHYYLTVVDIIGNNSATHATSTIKTNGAFTTPSGVSGFTFALKTVRAKFNYVQYMGANDGKYRLGFCDATYYKFNVFDLSITGVTTNADFVYALGISSINNLPNIDTDVTALVAWKGYLYKYVA